MYILHIHIYIYIYIYTIYIFKALRCKPPGDIFLQKHS